MVSAQDRALDWWRLHDIGRHVSWAKIRAARLSAEFSLDVDAFYHISQCWTSKKMWRPEDIPFSRRILSSKEFLYRNIKHSSAALR